MQAKVVIKLRPYSSKGKLLSSNINVNEKIEFIDIWRETINHFPLNSKQLKVIIKLYIYRSCYQAQNTQERIHFLHFL